MSLQAMDNKLLQKYTYAHLLLAYRESNSETVQERKKGEKCLNNQCILRIHG